MNAFRARNLSHLAFPFLLCDATYVKARVGGRVVSRAVVVVTGVAEDASREVLGVAIGDSEDAAFRTEFLQSLRERGLHGVQLVISDSHLDLKAAIAKVFPGPPSSAVGCTSCATSSRRCLGTTNRWWRR